MAQLWDIPCINVRWLQDLYFGDLTTLSLPILHKYLCFETSDVTISLERCTPRVQDLMGRFCSHPLSSFLYSFILFIVIKIKI